MSRVNFDKQYITIRLFGLNIFIHISIYIVIQTILQYKHDGILLTYLFPFEEKGARLRLCPTKLKNISCSQTY